MDDAGFFDRRALRALALARRAEYARSRPFAHVVVDGFLPAERALALATSFPPPEHPGWKRRDHAEQSARLGQLQRTNFEGVASVIRATLAELCGMAFLDFLETLTGVPGLIADPHFVGAGLHCTLPGGHLAIHSDFDRDRRRHLARALTVILYLGERWDPAWGGALELHPDGEGEVVRIDPLPNRLVVMEHGERHWHGHPHPLACPAGEARRSIAAYYYVVDPIPTQRDAHGAIWRETSVVADAADESGT